MRVKSQDVQRKTPNSGAKDFKFLYFLSGLQAVTYSSWSSGGTDTLYYGKGRRKNKKKKNHGTSLAVTLALALYPEATCFEKRSVSVAQPCRRTGSEE